MLYKIFLKLIEIQQYIDDEKVEHLFKKVIFQINKFSIFLKNNKRIILFFFKKEFTTADFILINYQKNYNLKYL